MIASSLEIARVGRGYASSLNDFAKRFAPVKDFAFTWERWGNWDANPPWVAAEGSRILGFHAPTLGRRSPYLNVYYIAVDPDARGLGIARKLLDVALVEAKARGLSRLKLKAHFDAPEALRFWERSLGLPRFAQDDVQYWYDVDIAPVENVSGLIEWMQHPRMHRPAPEAARKAVIKAGGRLL